MKKSIGLEGWAGWRYEGWVSGENCGLGTVWGSTWKLQALLPNLPSLLQPLPGGGVCRHFPRTEKHTSEWAEALACIRGQGWSVPPWGSVGCAGKKPQRGPDWQPAQQRAEPQKLWCLILSVNLIGLKDAQVTCKTLFLGVPVRG